MHSYVEWEVQKEEKEMEVIMMENFPKLMSDTKS